MKCKVLFLDSTFLVLNNLENIQLVEVPIYNYTLGYTGIVDCVAEYQNKMCVIEFESVNRIKPLYDKPLQIASYLDAINQQYGWNITDGLLVRATANKIDATLFSPSQMAVFWQKWREKVAQFGAHYLR